MLGWSNIIGLVLIFSGFGLAINGYREARKNNYFKDARWWSLWGIFVWGDALVLGLFWAGVGLMGVIQVLSLKANLIIYSVFWVVRSWGEINYWLNEQFASKHRNKPEGLWLGKQAGEAIWFINQVFWQVVLVSAILATGYLVRSL